jgi:hypothetical protein
MNIHDVLEHNGVLEFGEITNKGEGVMNKRHVFYVGLVLLAAMVLFGAPMIASAAHPDVTTLKADGTAAGATDAYSPKQTCGGCHFNCADGSYTTNTALYCANDAARTVWFGGGNCNTAGKCPDYASATTKTVSKHKGFPTSTGVAFAAFDAKAPMHGASIGKHSGEGRNEELAANQRPIWGAPAFISSPGMIGRY